MNTPNFEVLLHVTAAVAVIVVLARVCGALAEKVGQPAVVGEMVSGILLGPTLLGSLAPGFTGYLFTDRTRPVLYTVAMLGLCLYMFLVGADHEIETGRGRDRWAPVALAVTGVVGPAVLGGLGGGLLLAGERPAGVAPWVYAVFLGGALSITAFPMLARVLQERRMVHTRFGRTATTAAAVDDALAWCLLAVVTSLVTRGSALGAVTTVVLPALALAVAVLVVVPRVFRSRLEAAVHRGHLDEGLLAALLATTLVVGWAADAIGIYSVFGGFLVGVALPRVPGFAPLLHGSALGLVRTLMLPLFFAFSGLNTDLRTLASPSYLLPLVALVLVAAVTKSAAGYVVLRRWFRWSHGEAFAMGAIMNARGLMILIFINAGLDLGVLSRPAFSMLVVVAVVTTAAAVPLYRRHFSDAVEEAAREEGLRRRPRATAVGAREPEWASPG
ncbi:cation:proton antiporter [Kineococcus rhizosphaerae]|uniref:Transporter (CPA2 family) n=1 Tax=Kineococcus rhizosphaerae TaxID=559628 RepID=A0A2T0QYP6_9ACTN|nr:cation:proton antiporter [Kineococcus rhizosphaerae]PRY11497.1 transporter (CPA2 family) [Kineococcus rhizosphaerae]